MIIQAIRVVFGLIYLLFLPGFAASWIIHPGKREIDVIERIAYSLGLSLPLSVLPVMFLNYFPGIPVTALTVFLVVGAVTATATALAVYRIKFR